MFRDNSYKSMIILSLIMIKHIYLLHIKKRIYYQNYYITHSLLLTRVIKNSFFVILKFWYKRTRVQILQKSILFLFFHLFMI